VSDNLIGESMAGKPGHDTPAKLEENLRREAIERTRLAAKPIVSELNRLGFEVSSIDDLYVRKLPYKSAIPYLIRCLSTVTETSVKESIVRALSVPWAKPTAALPLIEEFRKAPSDQISSLKWAIGNALEVVADDKVFDEISALARDKTQGKAREMLVAGLGKMKHPRSTDTLLELLSDEQVEGHALWALRRLKATLPRSIIERFLSHRHAWVRKEANRLLARS
jgi:PBS lyase HEAT-like repeat